MAPFPAAWRRVLLWVRVAFACAGLASGMLLSPRSTPWAGAAAGVYLVLSLLVPLRKRRGGAFALLVLFADVVFFLVLVSAGIGSVIWLPAFYYLYLLAEAVFVYRAPEVLVVTVVSAIFCIAVQTENVFPIRRTAVIGGALAYAFAVYKRRLESRMEELACEARETRRKRSVRGRRNGSASPPISMTVRCKASSACRCGSKFCANSWSGISALEWTTCGTCKKWLSNR
jgi:hypothetical protein